MKEFDIKEYLENRAEMVRLRDALAETDYLSLFAEEMEEFNEKIADIDRVIFAVRSPLLKNILVMFYINGYTAAEIARKMNYSTKTIRRKLKMARLAAEIAYRELYL